MKILMLLFGYFPSDVRPRKEALTLKKAGYDVSVLCCAEENQSNEFESIKIPRLGKTSDWEGKMTPFQLLKFWILCFKYLIKSKDYSILHCHDLTALPPAVLYNFIFPRTKIIYDAHETYPDAVAEKLGDLIGLPFLLLEKFCVKFVDNFLSVSIPQQDLMKKRYNIKNFVFLPNLPTEKDFYLEEKTNDKDINKIVILYAGGIHINRGYEQLVEAIELLKNRNDFIVKLVGGGPLFKKIEKMIEQKELTEKIKMEGNVHYKKVNKYLNSADIGIALYQSTINANYSLSNKIFEYMICGLPMIFPYLKGSAKYLKKIGAIGVNPANPEDIARKIEYLIDHPEIRAEMRKKEIELSKKLTWESSNDEKLLTLYRTTKR